MTLQGQLAATRDDSGRLDVEFSRLLCDDGHPASRRDGTGNIQESRGIAGWTAAGLDAESRMRQEDHRA